MDTDSGEPTTGTGNLVESQPSPSGSAGNELPLLDLPSIGQADQACKECRRRKARCNRSIPTCNLCTRYRRHCLYEKHARTPLTRKHLTEVEARLERAEALLQRMRTLVPSNLRSWEQGNGTSTGQQLRTQESTEISSSSFDFSAAPLTEERNEPGSETPRPPNRSTTSTQRVFMRQSPSDGAAVSASRLTLEPDHQRMLESPPGDDFEWCEQEPVQSHGLSPDGVGTRNSAADDDSPTSDGMASLTVNEKEAGYLGVASGAAFVRLLGPRPARSGAASFPPRSQHVSSPLSQPNPNRHIGDAMIDAYFRLYHVSYPIIYEPTFRAQYSEVIPRPNGVCWTVLAYVVAAIGVWSSATASTDALDTALFAQARSMLTFDFFELGNITLVQALTLASNYQQKRDKPNSGYNYLGLAVRMAMGLGLHKEFQGWNISPLNMEIRRRVWCSLCVFDVGATITFSRPDVWPYEGVEVSFPLNVHDKDLTAAATSYPAENTTEITPYTAVATQARFHTATHKCYERVISKPFPTAQELLRLDSEFIEPWRESVPPYFSEEAAVPAKYAFSQAVMSWRLRNLRIIMYRPFVIRRALMRRVDFDSAVTTAYERCLADAKSTIEKISEFWARHEHNRLAAWYALYFLFQAALIPCICLRNDPSSPGAPGWRSQVRTTLDTITSLSAVNVSSGRCYQIIYDLCGIYLELPTSLEPSLQRDSVTAAASELPTGEGTVATPAAGGPYQREQPVGESPQTQINNVFTMMWPNVPPFESADVVMGEDAAWMEFLRAGGGREDWAGL